MGKHAKVWGYNMSTPVTTNDVYTEILGLRTEMRTMITHLAVIENRNVNADEVHKDHETRLRQIETGLIRIKVIVSMIGAIAGIIAGIASSLIGQIH